MWALGLGAAAATTVLDHSLVPFPLSRPVYLRLVKTLAKAAAYAAGGFHVSVDRGQAGGCFDPWKVHDSGMRAVPCLRARDREDVRLLWTEAATRYQQAYAMVGPAAAALSASGLDDVKEALRQANIAAGAAFRAEGIEPPRDPGAPRSEPGEAPLAGTRRIHPLLIAGGVGLAGALLAIPLIAVARKRRPRSASSHM